MKKLNVSIEDITVADFRKDKILRGIFIQGIAHEYSDQLADIDTDFHKKMRSFDI